MKTEAIINARQFQQQFAKISKQLRPGETVIVTNRGEKVGSFTRSGNAPRGIPDFYANLQKLGRSPSVGQKMIDQMVNDLP